MNSHNTFRIGAGSGFAGDRFEPAEILARQGALDALVFECLAERTIALAQQDLLLGSGTGYDRHLLRRLRPVMPSRNGMKILSNAGAANPRAAAIAALDLAHELGREDLVVAAVAGDDVLAALDLANSQIIGSEDTLADLGDRVISANAYLGVEGIMGALDQDAQIIITGRVGDAALFLAPLIHHFGWDPSDSQLMADGTLVGHLLECAGQLTGGYFADNNAKKVDGLATLGFPIAAVDAGGSAEYSKVDGTGGILNRRTVIEQLLYEIDDPTAYLTPDVTVDFSAVVIEDHGDNRVRVQGAKASGRPEQLKVSVGVRDGYLGVAEIAYAGEGALRRSQLAAEILNERWTQLHGLDGGQLRTDFVGHNATRSWWDPDVSSEPLEVRLRMSTNTLDRSQAVTLAEEVEALYTNGPAGGGGVTANIKPTVGVVSTLIPRELVTPTVEVFK